MNTRFQCMIASMLIVTASLVSGCGDKNAATPPAKPATAAKVDPAMAKMIAEYPLDTCVVGGEKLGSMGAPADFMHEGRLVRFCCSSCEGKFKENPAKYLALIDAAKAKKGTGEGPEKPKTN